jgi:hypothetical protein
MIVETQINNRYSSQIPLLQFYATTEHRSASDWSGLSTACVTHMMRNSGFGHLFYSKLNYPHRHRQIFVGCINDEHRRLFADNPNLTYCDEAYWADCYEKSRVWDGSDWKLGTDAQPLAPTKNESASSLRIDTPLTPAQPTKPTSLAHRFRKLFNASER